MQKTVSRTKVRTVEDGGDIIIGTKGTKHLPLNQKRKRFCELFATDREFFGNGLESVSEAYGYDLSNPKDYKAAANQATRLLKNGEVLDEIDRLLELARLNDQFVDKQLALVITQNADFGSKMSAIREYNKLKGRITEKRLNLNQKLPTPLLGGDSRKKIPNKKAEEIKEADIVVSEKEVSVPRKRRRVLGKLELVSPPPARSTPEYPVDD